MNIFLSIDPGLEDTGWSVIETDGKKILLRDFGLIKTNPKQKLSLRLKNIYDEISEKIEKYSITEGAIEEMFFSGKIKTQVFSFYAKGIILLAFENYGIKYREYNPLSVKKLVCGNGRADKYYVERVIRIMFGIKEKLYPDVSDAISIGIAASRFFFLKNKITI
ncbi:MAG: crossover junction endodeoxyribonuclease RuvC [Elusimicrobiales bacterium]|nr:crossover junction endodeoxyribonuclease RuvC [Elusimicrobiales bacterium]